MMGVLREAHAQSAYAKLEIDEPEAKRLLMGAIQRHGGKGEAGTLVNVAETDGKVEGLIIGVLQRVYFIGKDYTATDLMWVGTERASARDKIGLMLSLTEWAKAHRKVVEVVCNASGAFDAEKTARIMEKLGFAKFGGLWRMETQ
jgi:hypothetical protein